MVMKYTLKTREKGEIQIVEANAALGLDALTREDVLELVKAHGAVLFRGFDTTLDAFSALVSRASDKVTLDPARKHFSDNAQLVDAGTDPVGLHLENGNAPNLPDLAWFYCKKAAKRGSQTTYCDGYSVLDDLDPAYNQDFTKRQIKYARHLPEALWKKYTLNEVDGLERIEQVTFEHLQQLAAHNPGQTFTLLEEGVVYSELVVPAIRQSKFSQVKGFANSLLGPSYNYEPPKITFGDDQKIDEAVWQHINEVTEAHTKNIDWQDHDVVVLDNTRVMHGRREIIDTDRELFNALSYVA
ncbi:taurine catabolism dioxygenase TauD [Pseudoalteromonas rubra]|uniref:Taurine catabolism dioxygenase TauD n=2 Tax=Pseudoalteromonas rubra TaxID=43658 RepID=A0A5S3X062_9GAMM|nr:taurine catabolism dioxygenase TauD [Pseudoalteromonas rubra]